MAEPGDPPITLKKQLEALLEEMLSPWGHTAARRRLERLGLDPRLAEDLVSIVGVAMSETFHNRSEPYPDLTLDRESLRRFANCVFASRAKDLYSKVLTRPPDHGYSKRTGDRSKGDDIREVLVPNPAYQLVDQPLEPHDVVTVDNVKVDEFVANCVLHADTWRGDLHRRLARSNRTVGSAAFAAITCAQHPEIDLAPDVPLPDGNQKNAWPLWVGVFYSGRDDCFAAVGAETPTIRKRRSRAIEPLAKLLVELIETGNTERGRP